MISYTIAFAILHKHMASEMRDLSQIILSNQS